mmetsp:Transcript_17311/g.36143  ORF Transcript_17311/g.36143 Transcript_17311/m.36143 type:complete len:122 (-) Transcript_17311:72-437(-)
MPPVDGYNASHLLMWCRGLCLAREKAMLLNRKLGKQKNLCADRTPSITQVSLRYLLRASALPEHVCVAAKYPHRKVFEMSLLVGDHVAAKAQQKYVPSRSPVASQGSLFTTSGKDCTVRRK